MTMVTNRLCLGDCLVTETQPQLSVNAAMYDDVANYNGQYLILMLDPDASTPEQPDLRFFLHWLAPNVTQTQGADGQRKLVPPSNATGAGLTDFVSYRAPAPGVTSSAHRYILYAFEQPDSFAVPAAFEGLAGGQNRSNFNLTSFMAEADLERPLAAEYFYVSRQAAVPGDFVGAAGGTYPGGNGGAIFEDSPNAAGNATTTTASGTATGSAATAAATTTSTSAAAPRWWRAVESVDWHLGAGIWGVAGAAFLLL